jgi:hypothetical protein
MLARSLAAAALTCAAAAAGAQTPAQPPLDRAGGPPAAYRSAYEGYRPYVEEPLAPWREVNDTVERVGGHAGVLRDEARTPPPPATLPATAPKGAGHDAHHRK